MWPNLFTRLWWAVQPLFYTPHTLARLFRKQGATVGDGCVFFTRSLGSEPYLVTIEDEVLVSDGVRFYTHDGGVWSLPDSAGQVNKYGRIRIGRRAFIGAQAILLPGANVGERSIIGAGAVVAGEIPPGVVAAGVPAHVLMTVEEYAEKARAASLRLTSKEFADRRDEPLHRRELERMLPELAEPPAWDPPASER